MAISPLSDFAYKQVLTMVEAMTPEQRLPSEDDLSRQLGVSRPVLRQALARLRTEGWVYARRGAGNFVGEPPALQSATFGPLHSIPDVRSFLEFRCLLEAESAACAARCGDPNLRDEITRRRRQLESALAHGELGVEEDIAFHAAIAAASGNRFFSLTMNALAEQTRVSIRLIRELSPQPMVRRSVDVRNEHRAIDDAIQAGDADAAREAMLSHLRGGLTRLFGRAAPVTENDQHHAPSSASRH
ncbi:MULTISPECIES: FadR/GntR family transcriptional regulator [unclassified Achromobacter]|uniref:FadR/GntR family transcriptional regulator n=1 Tax=unclassified Achromobacter TaxID=2626865 RepID=UPI00117772FD|nr:MULTISPECIES: FCD domain-containing protein [unclassified Achromobacter]